MGLWHHFFPPKHTSCLLSLMCPPAFFPHPSQAREARRHQATEWLILDSVTMWVHFPRFWFPVWKFKILWHVGINITFLPTHRQSQSSCQKERAFNPICFGMEHGTEACKLLPTELEEGDLRGSRGKRSKPLQKLKENGKKREDVIQREDRNWRGLAQYLGGGGT